jgi:hypothetical protein
MRRNLFVELLVHERNGYQRYLPADIKHYLSRITKRYIQKSLCAYDAARSVTMLILRTLLFGLNVTLMLIFIFKVLLSYRAIHVFSV